MFYWVYEETYTMARPEFDDDLWDDVRRAAEEHPVYPSATVLAGAVLRREVDELLDEEGS